MKNCRTIEILLFHITLFIWFAFGWLQTNYLKLEHDAYLMLYGLVAGCLAIAASIMMRFILVSNTKESNHER